MIGALAALFARDLRVARRIGGGGALGVTFFLTLVTVIPFGIGPDMALLSRIGPAVLWIAALLATLLGLDRLFQADHDDGSLAVLAGSDLPLELVVAVKCLAHWCLTGLPLVAAAPLLGLLLAQDAPAQAALVATLLVGTPALTVLGAVGAALTVTVRRGGLLLAVLVVPLAIPVLIFGVSAAEAAVGGTVPFGVPFSILCGLSLLSLATAPFAAAAALRLAAE